MEESKKIIQIKNVVKNFDDTVVLKGVSLDIYDNEFVTLLGPSGCGKTTLLRILGGFVDPSSGEVLFNNEDILSLPPYKRDINTVFQKYALFPHLNVYDNVAFGLKLKKMPKDVIDRKVRRMLKLVNLDDYGKRNINEMSGGQQQRIAIARRTTRRTRPQAPKRDANRAQAHSTRSRYYVYIRHARPRRSSHDVRQNRRHE